MSIHTIIFSGNSWDYVLQGFYSQTQDAVTNDIAVNLGLPSRQVRVFYMKSGSLIVEFSVERNASQRLEDQVIDNLLLAKAYPNITMLYDSVVGSTTLITPISIQITQSSEVVSSGGTSSCGNQCKIAVGAALGGATIIVGTAACIWWRRRRLQRASKYADIEKAAASHWYTPHRLPPTDNDKKQRLAAEKLEKKRKKNSEKVSEKAAKKLAKQQNTIGGKTGASVSNPIRIHFDDIYYYHADDGEERAPIPEPFDAESNPLGSTAQEDHGQSFVVQMKSSDSEKSLSPYANSSPNDSDGQDAEDIDKDPSEDHAERRSLDLQAAVFESRMRKLRDRGRSRTNVEPSSTRQRDLASPQHDRGPQSSLVSSTTSVGRQPMTTEHGHTSYNPAPLRALSRTPALLGTPGPVVAEADEYEWVYEELPETEELDLRTSQSCAALDAPPQVFRVSRPPLLRTVNGGEAFVDVGRL